jgi:hypothetical protein
MKLPSGIPLKIKVIIQRFMGQYPLSGYHFMVEWGGKNTSFSEVSVYQ